MTVRTTATLKPNQKVLLPGGLEAYKTAWSDEMIVRDKDHQIVWTGNEDLYLVLDAD